MSLPVRKLPSIPRHKNAISALHGHNLGVDWNRVVIQDDWDDQSDTEQYVIGFQPTVERLIHLGSCVDAKQDQLYMPHRKTNLHEAISSLASNGKLGIQGGHLFWHDQDQSFSAALLGKEPVKITLEESRVLLRTNYSVSCED